MGIAIVDVFVAPGLRAGRFFSSFLSDFGGSA